MCENKQTTLDYHHSHLFLVKIIYKQCMNICNGIFHISFFKALLINEGEMTRERRELGRNDPGRTGIGAICCHSEHILSESKPLHDDFFLRKIFSLLCSTIFH
jgi:hypothetical protein